MPYRISRSLSVFLNDPCGKNGNLSLSKFGENKYQAGADIYEQLEPPLPMYCSTTTIIVDVGKCIA